MAPPGIGNVPLAITYINPILAFLIIITNIFEIIIIYKTRVNRKLNPCIMFVLNLAWADLLVGFTMVAGKVYYYLVFSDKTNAHYALGLDISFFFAIRISLIVSVLNLMAFTFVRMLAAKKPLLYRKTTTKISIRICIAVWIISTVLCIVYYLSIRFTIKPIAKYVKYEAVAFPVVTTPVFVGFCYCYWVIYKTVQTHSLRPSFRINASASTLEKESQFRQMEKKIVRVAATAAFAFVVCWFPATVGSILMASGSIDDWYGRWTLRYVQFIFAFLNSLVNPLIFIVVWRKASLRWLYSTFCFRRNRRRINKDPPSATSTNDESGNVAYVCGEKV